MIALAALPWARIVGYGAIVAAVFSAGSYSHKVFSDRDIAQVKSAHAAVIASIQQTHNAAVEKAAADSQKARQQAIEVRQAYENQSAKTNSLVAVLRSSLRLRDDRLAAFVAGDGADDTLAACRADAAALGLVLQAGGRVVTELAAAAEQHANEVRALKAHNDVVEAIGK